MKIRILLLAGCLFALTACNESRYDLNKLVPEAYHKILYIKDGGKHALTLYDTEEDNEYTFSVVKSGAFPEQTASAEIKALTQEELNAKYSEPEIVNYKLIHADCYSVAADRLDFSSTDRYKMVDVFLKPQKVKALIESDPVAVWVLPLRVTSQTDSINAEMSDLFLRIDAVILPALGFTDTSIALNEYTYGSVSAISKEISVGLDTDNKWDITCEFDVDAEYVDTYNANNGTVFMALPDGTFSIPESMELPNGTTTSKITVTVDGNKLSPGDYMLPVRIKEVSLFGISSNAVYPLAIRIVGPQLDRTVWSIEANTQEVSGEGAGNGVAACALDGNLTTFWHSKWNGGSDALPHELIVDAKEEYTFSQFAMMQRQHNTQKDTRAGEFYVSSDKVNWTKVGNFTMQQIYEAQIFSIIPTKGRYFKIKIDYSYRAPYSSFAEIYAYGVK